MKARFLITANLNVAHSLRRRVVAVKPLDSRCDRSLGVPPRKASGSRLEFSPGLDPGLYSSLVPRCGVPLQSLTRIRKPQLHRSEGLTFALERELH
jgi:hypothetical protein